jgi:hypothetical protein
MSTPSRRSFLTTVAGAAAGAAGVAATGPSLLQSQARGAEVWDFSWMDKLTGKHRQVFDLESLDAGLRVVRNWYDAYETVFKLKHPEVNAVLGIAGSTFPYNAGDDLYRKFPIGEQWQVKDPATGQWATRNIFLEGGATPAERENRIRPLQARGAIMWMCNNALQRVASRLADAVGRPVAEVYAELRGGLNPGVILVPAHTMLLGLCQERGCSYEKV